MIKYLCKRFRFLCTNQEFLKYILIISIVLQSYMLIRSFFLMNKIDRMLMTLKNRFEEIKYIDKHFHYFIDVHSLLFKENLKINLKGLDNYCNEIINNKNLLQKEKMKFKSGIYKNIFTKIENFYLSLSKSCNDKIDFEKKFPFSIYKEIKNDINFARDEYVFYLLSYKKDYYLADALIFWLKYLVIISASISIIIYALIIMAFFALRKNNLELELKIKEIIKMKYAIDNSPVPVIITDNNGLIEYVNKEFEKVYGYSMEEVCGRKPSVIKGEIDENKYKELWDSLKKGSTWSGKFVNKAKDGEKIIVEEHISPIYDSKGNLISFVGIQRDITLQEKLINELIIAKQQADEASKAKSDFLSSMSHEIRTPLNAIVGMSDLLKETELTEEQKRYIEILSNASDSLLAIVNDILDISKIESGKVEIEKIVFNLEKLVYDICEIISIRASNKNVEVICRIKPDVPINLIGDPTKLRQIIMNLMGNSVKFVEKGWILLEIYKKSQDGNNVVIGFKVSDTGVGIPPDKLDSIFDKFAQADASTYRKYGGTGLGLAISKMLVELMGGNISVSSVVGEGTTFEFFIPLTVTSLKEESNISLDIGSLRGLKIIIIDDNDINRIIFKEILSPFGLVIETYSSPIAAYKEMVAKKYDIAIVDYNMPEMNGYELIKKIIFSPEVKQKPKILLTTSDILKFKKEELRSLDVKFLVKPIKKMVLLDTLLNIIKNKKEDIIKVEKDVSYSKSELPQIKILIVDDSEDNRILMSSYLKGSPVIFDMAEDGQKAVDMVLKNEYDIVFMDMQMPVMDGMIATKMIRELEIEKGLKKNFIVALTANVLKEQIEQALKNGFDDYLTKPIKKNTFYEYLIKYAKKMKD